MRMEDWERSWQPCGLCPTEILCSAKPTCGRTQVNELPWVHGTAHVHLRLTCTPAQTWGIQGHFGEGMERTVFPLPWRQPSPQALRRLMPFSWQYSTDVKLRILPSALADTDPSVSPLGANARIRAWHTPRGVRALTPSHLCFKGRKWGRKYRKSEISPHEPSWIYCRGREKVVRTPQQVGFSFLEVSTYLAIQTLTAASFLSQGQTQNCHSQVGNLDLAEGVDGWNYPRHQQNHHNGDLTHEAAQRTKE